MVPVAGGAVNADAVAESSPPCSYREAGKGLVGRDADRTDRTAKVFVSRAALKRAAAGEAAEIFNAGFAPWPRRFRIQPD